MTRTLIAIALLLVASQLSAQTDFETYKQQQQQKLKEYNRQEQDFKAYSRKQREEFEAYRAKLNAEYAKYMRKAWTKFSSNMAKPVPSRPEPPRPIIKKSDESPRQSALPVSKVVSSITTAKPVAPAVPLPEVESVTTGFSFMYYGTPCRVSLTDAHKFRLQGTSEGQVADAWTLLSNDNYLTVLAECVNYREELNLCDWGYVRLLQVMTESFFPSVSRNEAVLMQMYLLVQSGYKVRIARTGNRLVLLLPMEQEVYNYSFLTIDGMPYYIVDDDLHGRSYYVFNRSFPNERRPSLYIANVPNLKVKNGLLRILTDGKQAKATVAINKNLIDFYNDYPRNAQWNLYSTASLSSKAKSGLYPMLWQMIEGKSEVEAANILLHFVQTAFEYQTDDVQFGVERPLFADEMLYYPYCDCEDRSIFYSILVRDLLGLDVVLLNYPGHLATAVRFADETKGDHIILSDKKYLICDPTYIGADIGEAMPSCLNETAIVVKI